MKKFILGFITGGIICAAVTGFAVEYAVTANPYPVKVNGSETAIEGYNINDNTYFKLRDVADAVGGFTVGFSDNTITIDTETAPEPTSAPVSSAEPLPEVPIKTVDGVEYVYKPDIEEMLNSIGLGDYIFGISYFVNKNDMTPILSDIPTYDVSYIPYSYYQSIIIPVINNLR